jgi:hypothetical protein
MRVVCNTIDEFLEDLTCEMGNGEGQILQSCVRVSILRHEMNPAKKQVVLQTSAVVLLENGGEYILEAGINCGVDYEDSTKEMLGTMKANELKQKIASKCSELGLTVRPGMIHV